MNLCLTHDSLLKRFGITHFAQSIHLQLIDIMDFIPDLCSDCKAEVLSDHEALQCNHCHLWQHRVCADISRTEYHRTREQLSTWRCTNCERSPQVVTQREPMEIERYVCNIDFKYSIYFVS
jgi:hypothetical protein